ncbi:MAG: PAS domain S-box protein, partial [Candidatus Thorarchaeota archaeon]
MIFSSHKNSAMNSEEFFQTVMNHINYIIIELDLKGNIIYMNAQANNLLGYKKEDIVGINCFKFIHKEDQSKLINKMKILIQYGGSLSGEYRVLHNNGYYLQLFINGTVQREKNFIQLIAILQDISQIKKSEEKYRFITENINDIITLYDDRLDLIFINGTHENILGYSKEEMFGKSALEFLHPDDIKRAKKNLREGQGRGKFKIRTKDNSYKWMDVNGRALIDSEGNQRILIVSRDITKEKEIEKRLRESELELKKKNRELKKLNFLKNEFLCRASHELKAPLTTISGNAQLAMNLYNTNSNPELFVMLKEIQDKCEQLTRIINKLIASSKLETSKIELQTSKEDLLSLIKLCVDEVQTLVKMKNLRFKLDLKHPIISKFNIDHIHEVITNLLTNAINYSPLGTIIEIKSVVKSNIIVISIKDEGIGFTEDEKKRIFQKFSRIRRNIKDFDLLIEGSGLGLYISRKIIELHGGEIWVESQGRNKGSTFYFTLPL